MPNSKRSLIKTYIQYIQTNAHIDLSQYLVLDSQPSLSSS